MQILKHRPLSLVALALSLAVGQSALADGTETLGAPSIGIASGTGLVSAGVGLEEGQPGEITIDVPASATIQQVLLYWSHEDGFGGDDTVNVDGIDVTGTQIGGPAFFFDFAGTPVEVHGFRADITALGLVANGPNTLTVQGLDAQVSDPGTGAHGAGVIVILDEGGPAADVQLLDGVDLAFCGFPEPRKSTVPQNFTYAMSDEDRVAELTIFVGSVSPDRLSAITLDFNDGTSTTLFDPITADEGLLFDALTLPVLVPAGSSALTASVQSANSAGTCVSENQSITWLAAALTVPPPPPPPGGQGCTPGYWKQPHHFDSWEATGYLPGDDYETELGVDASFSRTLARALRLRGGGERALGRHATAALLNASHPGVDYAFTPQQVIDWVQEAYATGDFNGVKDILADENERGCPLD